MARRALSALVVAVGFASFERRALASPLPDTLSFQLSACPSPELDANSLADAVRSELEADGVGRVIGAPSAESDGSLTVHVDCDAALTAQVTLKSNHTGRERHERIALGDAAPSARARALALALAELMRADWPVLSGTPSPRTVDAASESNAPQALTGDGRETAASDSAASKPAAPKSAASKPPASKASPKSTPKKTEVAAAPVVESPTPDEHKRASPANGPRNAAVTLALAARLRWFIDYQSVLLGGDLGADFRALRLRAEVLASSASDALGSASLGSAALCVGYRVFDWRLGAMNLAAYPMASAGITWLRGDSAQPSTRVEPATGFYGDVRVVLEASLPRWALAPTLSADVGRASGFVARSGDHTLGATGGFFAGASLGARY